jgi:FdhD protein
MKSPVSAVKIVKYIGKSFEKTEDLLAGEEPLEIRLKYFDGLDFRERRLAVTMRTAGNDFELAIGFLLTEGIIVSYEEVQNIFYCEEIRSKEEAGNVVIIHLVKQKVVDDSTFNRNFYVNSSCGVCGKSSLESIQTVCHTKYEVGTPVISSSLVHAIPELAGKEQNVFKYTGALHASALFNLKGEIEILREDIGRHNALDKLIGARAIEGKSHAQSILFVSGRAGFELIQKAVVAGIPMMIAVGAPSSLAVDLAKTFGMTLIGFARKDRFNVYSGPERISD